LNRFLQNLSLLLFRVTLGSLVLLFAAKELAKKWSLILPVFEHYEVPGAEWTYVGAGILILLLGIGLVVGFYTRLMALLLFLILAAGGTFYKPVDGGLTFQLITLYGVILLGLVISGGGQWAVKRSRVASGKTSVLESEQSLLASQKGAKSIFESKGSDVADEDEEEEKLTTLEPPKTVSKFEQTIPNEEDDDDDASYPGDDTELEEDKR